jgi:seryl-tRNA synthetase
MLDINLSANGDIARVADGPREARGSRWTRRVSKRSKPRARTSRCARRSCRRGGNAASKQIGIAKSKGSDVALLMAEVAGLGDET